MSRILIFGSKGQVGWELERSVAPLGEVIALDRNAVDATDPEAIRRSILEAKPTVVINATAHTAVDRAESEPALAHAINATAPEVMAREADRVGALFVHYSTDYVFDGRLDRPYREDDPTNPLSVYGRTKLAGEQAIRAVAARHLIFRTSWVFAARGSNFVKTILRLASQQPELKIVADQHGAPTFARHIAAATAAILTKGAHVSGTFHLTAADPTSWHGFAEEIVRRSGRSINVVPIPTIDFPRPAPRPSNSRLDNTRLSSAYGIELPSWRIGLAQCLAELGV